jgi:hypothetical protein
LFFEHSCSTGIRLTPEPAALDDDEKVRGLFATSDEASSINVRAYTTAEAL